MQIFKLNIIYNLNNNRQNILKYILLSSITSVVTISFYHYFFQTKTESYESQRAKAIAVAEREIVLSDRIQGLFRSSAPTDFIKAAELSRKAVVFIKSNSLALSPGQSNSPFPANIGSGVIISSDGYIATNNHVIDGATKIEVTLNDNRVFVASIVGTDTGTDVALLKIEAGDLDYLIFDNSDSLQIGEWVMAVGNPFRLQSTVTAGIVSAKARNINLLENRGIESFIQTDAAVNPGNSGGALINTKGNLVGICTAILSNSGRYEGFSFAIPSNLVKKVITDLREFGTVQRGWLGIEIENMSDVIAKELGLEEIAGVLISSVFKGGGAFEAGLKTNDVIISVNNVRTSNTSEFMELLGRYRPGQEINIIYTRARQKNVVKAVLRNQLNSTDLIGIRDDATFRSLGIELREPDSYERVLIVAKGIIVVSVKNGSIIGQTKMEPGYIITKINNVEITSVNMFLKALELNRGKTIILEGFYPKFPGEYPYTFIMPK